MGGIVSQFEKQAKQKSNCPLLNTSLAKLRDYHGSFKAICEYFSLDLHEFEQIFGSNESSFVIWDTDDNGLIDALELFSGLIIFADAKFEDRIRFLFDLFDFNELHSISGVDLEFLIHSCLSSTFKIYSIGEEINEEEISEFVSETFIEDVRINISQLLKWSAKSEEIQKFFKVIRKDSHSSKGAAAESLNEIDSASQKFDKSDSMKVGF